MTPHDFLGFPRTSQDLPGPRTPASLKLRKKQRTQENLEILGNPRNPRARSSASRRRPPAEPPNREGPCRGLASPRRDLPIPPLPSLPSPEIGALSFEFQGITRDFLGFLEFL